MIIESAKLIESSITFTAHTTDSNNIVLLSEKENYTYGTLYSFPSVGIWVVRQSPAVPTPFAGRQVSWQEGFGGTWLCIYTCYIHKRNRYLWVVNLCSVALSVSREQVLRTMLSWISPKVTMLHGSQWRKFFRQNLLQGASIRKYLNPISLSNARSWVA